MCIRDSVIKWVPLRRKTLAATRKVPPLPPQRLFLGTTEHDDPRKLAATLQASKRRSLSGRGCGFRVDGFPPEPGPELRTEVGLRAAPPLHAAVCASAIGADGWERKFVVKMEGVRGAEKMAAKMSARRINFVAVFAYLPGTLDK